MNIISPKTMWSLIILIGISSFFLFDHEYLYIPHIVSKIIFVVCAVYWFSVVCLSFFVHREAYKNSYATSGVVTSGIYKKMKHPMYVGDICLFVGLSILFPMVWVWITTLLGIIIFIWFMNIENAVLEERFGNQATQNQDGDVKNTKERIKKTKPKITRLKKEKEVEKKISKPRTIKTKKKE
ncbi:hypothetical protein C4565_10675 [Candidatus Parcubacteria bacterium]|jgi:protein-S-isoprenylcysteine O-methyltransferase Ste14|nr:MAG: hypothetical protein C4565_10675 [Candidatus Parcubacteria bacterium]